MSRHGFTEQLRLGELTSADLTARCLARIAERDAELRAFVTVTAELARTQAEAADRAREGGGAAGPLHGLPLAIKDNIDTAGVRTTAGSAFFADRVPQQDAEIVRRLREAGAVLVGKAALHEFAYGGTTQNPHHGNCRNPWDTSGIPGGSSGGSGAALAAGMCAAALGTDTGGSVRIPGSLNGVSALRPTTGRVSNRGVFPITWSFDTVGPMAHCVSDVAAVYAVIAGFDAGDPLSENVASDNALDTLDQGVAGLRIGLPRNFFFDDVDAEIAAGVRGAAEELAALGATVVDIDLPEAEAAVEACSMIIRAEALAIHRDRLRESPGLFGEDLRRRLSLGASVSGSDYAVYRETGRRWRRNVEIALEQVDVVLTPTAGTVAPVAADAETIETTRRLTRLTYGWSLAGNPALAVPCGIAGGLPFGMQLAGRPWEESTLLRAGAAFQSATDWHLRRPGGV